MNKKCQKFDYGEAGNMKHYNQVTHYASEFEFVFMLCKVSISFTETE